MPAGSSVVVNPPFDWSKDRQGVIFRLCQARYEKARHWYYWFVQEPVSEHKKRDEEFYRCMRKYLGPATEQ